VPKGLFLERVINTAKEELRLECDYKREAKNQILFRSSLMKSSLWCNNNDNAGAGAGAGGGGGGIYVPDVHLDLSSETVLTTDWVEGQPVDELIKQNAPQSVRDSVSSLLISLVLKELFEFRLVQTDPNWSNFLYDTQTDTLNLIDFGALNEYPVEFVREYGKLVVACANKDRSGILKYSRSIGFLCGRESPAMIKAHVEAAYIMGEPFAEDALFDFHEFKYGERMAEQGTVFLNHRLVPPPKEVYSLHRKLFGAISTCIKVRSRVNCRNKLQESISRVEAGAS